jgi:hypothetical protein
MGGDGFFREVVDCCLQTMEFDVRILDLSGYIARSFKEMLKMRTVCLSWAQPMSCHKSLFMLGTTR